MGIAKRERTLGRITMSSLSEHQASACSVFFAGKNNGAKIKWQSGWWKNGRRVNDALCHSRKDEGAG